MSWHFDSVLRAKPEAGHIHDDGVVELFLAERLAVNEVRVRWARKAAHNPPERVRLVLRRARGRVDCEHAREQVVALDAQPNGVLDRERMHALVVKQGLATDKPPG